MTLDAKNIIVTGGSGNLGSAVTAKLLAKGYQLIATVPAEAMRRDFLPHPKLDIRVVDLSDEEQSGLFVKNAIDQYIRIDAAMLLVGGFAMGNLAATGGREIRKQIALNFETAYYLTKPLFAHMMAQGYGRILFIGARPALVPAQGKDLIAYGLSKSLLFKLAEFLNEEAKGKNVSVSVVVPSTLDTPLNRKSMPDVNPDDWVKPEALADILEFIVSDSALAIRETIFKVYGNA